MNINSVNKGLSVYQSPVPTKPVNAKKTKATGNDTVMLSETAKDFRTVLDLVRNSADVRYDKVAEIREQVVSGNYKINPGDISEHILKVNYDPISF